MIRVRLNGPFEASWEDGSELRIRGSKLRGMIALLLTSPNLTRSRTFLQDMLWGRSGPAHGRSSLRGALSSLRRTLGKSADHILIARKDEIGLRPGSVTVVGQPQDGEFLEGVEISESRFEDWLRMQRQQEYCNAPLEPGALRPAIAITPMLNIVGSHEGNIIGDLLAQEITRSLSRSSFFDVISHLSTRQVDTRSGELQQIRSSLNCDYLSIGNVRLTDDEFVLNIDLIDARSGRILWTREFKDRLNHLLMGDSVVPWEASAAISRTVAQQSIKSVSGSAVSAANTHDLMMSAISLMHRQSFGSYSKARTILAELMLRMPGSAEVHAWLAKWYALNISQNWSMDRSGDADIARDLVEKALDIDPDCAFSLTISGYIHNNVLKRFDASDSLFERALAIDPNNALAWLLRGALDAFTDNGALAVERCAHARKLSPLDPQSYFFQTLSATAALANRDYADALALANLSQVQNERHISTHRVRTIALQRLGRQEEAVQSAQRLCALDENFTVGKYLRNHPAAEFATGQDWADALRSAGIKD